MGKKSKHIQKGPEPTNLIRLKNDPVRRAVSSELRQQEYNRLQKESEQSWSDLENIYESIAQSIIMSGKTIRDLLLVEGIKERLNNKQEMVIAINGFNKDIATFADGLKTIHDKHKDKEGIIDTSDFITSIEIAEEYRALSTQFDAVVMPNIVNISTEIGHTADQIIRERNANKLDSEIPTSENTE